MPSNGFVFLLLVILFPQAIPKKEPLSCDAAVHLQKSNSTVLSYTATFYTKWPPASPKCLWTLVGDEDCEIEISCRINIPKAINEDGDCTGNFVKITDGSEGEMMYCGEMELKRLRASEKLRDIFIILEQNGSYTREMEDDGRDYHSFEDNYFVHCFAKCGTGKAVKRLPKNLKTNWDYDCVCGMQAKPVKIEYSEDSDEPVDRRRRIVSGEDATLNEFPWHVALVYKGTRRPFCGGTLINNRFVVTAAHCFTRDNYTADRIEVLAHAHTLDLTLEYNDTFVDMEPDDPDILLEKDTAEFTQRFQVLEILSHPLFNIYFVDFDIALVRISPPVNLNPDSSSPTPVCLPPASTWDTKMSSWTGKLLTTSGWGKSSEDANQSTRVLQKLEDIPYIPYEKCLERMQEENGYRYNRRLICAGYPDGGKDACQGDSGGGLTLPGKDKKHLLIGIVSWGEGCARNDSAGFYTRVTEFIQWIHFHSAEHGSRWCLEEKGYQWEPDKAY